MREKMGSSSSCADPEDVSLGHKTAEEPHELGHGRRAHPLALSNQTRKTEIHHSISYPSVMSVACKLLTNTIQVSTGTIVSAVPGPGAMALLLRDSWVEEMAINGFDRLLGPLGSALLALFAGDKGISLLGCSPEERLDLLLGMASVFAGLVMSTRALRSLGGGGVGQWTYLDILPSCQEVQYGLEGVVHGHCLGSFFGKDTIDEGDKR